MGSGRGTGRGPIQRAARTLIFMVVMVGSLISAAVVMCVVDVIAPCLLLSAFKCCGSCFKIKKGWDHYSFHTSVLDIPLLSLMRSLIIFGNYAMCSALNVSYGPYVGVTFFCGLVSIAIIIAKICAPDRQQISYYSHIKDGWGKFSLFLCSVVLVIGHIVVACKVKCQAQRKMHVYRLDPEAMAGLHIRLYEKQSLHSGEGAWKQKLLQSN